LIKSPRILNITTIEVIKTISAPQVINWERYEKACASYVTVKINILLLTTTTITLGNLFPNCKFSHSNIRDYNIKLKQLIVEQDKNQWYTSNDIVIDWLSEANFNEDYYNTFRLSETGNKVGDARLFFHNLSTGKHILCIVSCKFSSINEDGELPYLNYAHDVGNALSFLIEDKEKFNIEIIYFLATNRRATPNTLNQITTTCVEAGIQSIICYSNLTVTSDPLKNIFGELTYRLEFSNSYQPIIETHLIKAPSKIEKEVLSPSTDIVTLKSCQPNTSDTEELAIDQPAKKQRGILYKFI